MKLEIAKKHMAENSVLHLTLLHQVVTQNFSAVNRPMNESSMFGRYKAAIISLQKMVEKSIAQLEKYEIRLRKLETSHVSSNDTGGAANVTGLVERTRRVAADIELLMPESNRRLEEIKSQVAFLTRRLEISQETALRLERQVESQVGFS